MKVRVDNELGENDIYSAIVRSRRIVEAMEACYVMRSITTTTR